jgi:two-component system chemotaxis response regulator CheB
MAKSELITGDKPRRVMVIGGSAGALSMVLNIAHHMRADMSLALIIVLHRKPAEENVLQEVLMSKTGLEVKEAEDKDELLPGVIYLAPADYHVLGEREGTLMLDDSEKVNFSRPSIDVTFESAAEIYGKSLLCVLLSGANADGAEGLVKAKEKGAIAVIQDPKSADFGYMPSQALEVVKPDLLLDVNNIDRLFELLDHS